MKFLLDAQLPWSLCQAFIRSGYEAKHTLNLPGGNRTADRDLADLADAEGWIVVSKDSDFVVSHLLHQKPRMLLQISTGNITNQELEQILIPNMKVLETAFQSAAHIEVNRRDLIVHG